MGLKSSIMWFIFKKKINKAIDNRIKEIRRIKKLSGDYPAKYAISNLIGLKKDLNLK